MAKEKKKSKGKKSGGMTWKMRMYLVMIIALSLIFLPTSMLLFFGMLPTLIAFFMSAKGIGARASTVAGMNLAGCVPFVFKLWSTGNDFEASIAIITNLNYMSIIYLAAAFGYMIDWVMTGIVSSFLYQKGLARMKAIKKRQEKLKENWGEGVTGRQALDIEEDI